MAKGQMRSGREAKKPKKAVLEKKAAQAPFSQSAPPPGKTYTKKK